MNPQSNITPTAPSDGAFAAMGEFFTNQVGLTKREYFAALALQGVVSADRILSENNVKYYTEYAVKLADALIEELNK